MAVNTTQVVGDPDPTTFKLIVDPDQLTVMGTLTAQITEQFSDRQDLLIEDFFVESDFSGVGPIRLVLNPNFESTATVFKLNSNNQVAGTHTMTLFLIIETPEQNLTYENVMLSSKEATLVLDGTLPIFPFLVNGETKIFQTLDLSVTIPASLVSNQVDPN